MPGLGDGFADAERAEQFAGLCLAGALRDADLWDRRSDLRVGVVLGTAAEFAWGWEHDFRFHPELVLCDPARDRRPLVPFLMNALELNGPTLTLSTACSTGNYALSIARRWLQLGRCDVCLAGACDLGMTPLVLAGFGNLRALSRRNDNPAGASRPFDKDRDGFVLGEGGTFFVLEPADHAAGRGARVYGELAGVGLSNDAHHPVSPCPAPAQASIAVRRALADARVNVEDVDYVNAHGTGTPVGDAVEAKGLRDVFGEHTRSIPVSSTKSMTGHLLTAAAALEGLACLAAIRRGAIPPTINLDNPDPECDLCHVPHAAREAEVQVALSNSFGFGGSNSCAVFRAV
jgi:3-oxoacyl-[acyl-carrier-protein] synthase II